MSLPMYLENLTENYSKGLKIPSNHGSIHQTSINQKRRTVSNMHYAMELIANAKEAAFVADAVNMFEQREGILALKLFFAESCLHTVKHHAPSIFVSMFLTPNSSDGKRKTTVQKVQTCLTWDFPHVTVWDMLYPEGQLPNITAFISQSLSGVDSDSDL